MNWRPRLPTIESAFVWLFLLQAIRVLLSSLFGVIYDAVFDQQTSFFVVVFDVLLIIAAMLTPLLLRRLETRPLVRSGAALMVALARLPLTFAPPLVRLYASVVLLGAAAFYLAYLLRRAPRPLVTSMIIGLGIDQFLRALDYTYDPSLRPDGLPLALVLVLGAILVTLGAARQRFPLAPDRPHLSTGLALGAALLVESSLLALPNGLSRWTGMTYGWAAPLLLLVTLLPLGPTLRAVDVYLAILLWPVGGVISIVALALCLALASWLTGPLAALGFLLAQPLLLFGVFNGVCKKRVPADDHSQPPGLAFSLGLLLFLVLSFAFAFTFTYPYTLTFFRGMGTPVLLLGALIAAAPVYSVPIEPELPPLSLRRITGVLASVTALTLVCAALTRSPSPAANAPRDALRLATYNIHYGYDGDWNFTLSEMAEAIEEAGVDVIVMQEVDAGRVTSYSVDDALWLGRRLGMHVVYQPTLEKLSGIALLSRYPLQEQDGRWLTSALEQTAIVHAVVAAGGEPLHVYGVWLGLEPEERAVQLEEALNYIGDANPAALGGDMNAGPDSPVYERLLAAGLEDPFMALGRTPAPTSPAVHPTERIDYIWLRGLQVRDAWVSASTASDHRMVVVEIEPP